MKIYRITTKEREVVKTHSAGGREYKHPKKVKESFEERYEINDVAEFLAIRFTEQYFEANLILMAKWLAHLTIGDYRALEEILNENEGGDWWRERKIRYEIRENEKD